ncbi:MAG: zinc ribbon domain-containing protein [Thermoplasmata archaeon]
MEAEGSRILGCPNCGFRVAPQDEECPRCGNRFATETKFECPFCGELVPRGAEACPSCFVNFAEFQHRAVAQASDESIDKLLIEIINMEASEAKAQDKRLSCPRCSWLLDGNEETCPKCGMAFTADAVYQCPICGAIVSATARSCSECGTPFSDEAKAKLEELRRRDVEAALTSLMEALETPDEESATEAADVGKTVSELHAPEEAAQEPPGEAVESKPPAPPEAPKHPEVPKQEPVVTEPVAQVEKPTQAPKKPTKTRKLKAKPSGPKA